jgi:multiple sugar transport system ATP-binding protein
LAEIRFEGVTRRYDGAAALRDISLTAPDGRFTVLTGPPGCGKSVLLRLLVGLERPDSGRILLGGEDVTDAPPASRPLGYVPQSFALYPHLTVRDNIGYPLRLAGSPRARIGERVEQVAATLSIGHLLDKTPDTLSGGEKQRTAVARGLAKDARVFALDDPLVGLDYKLRERLMADLKALARDLGATVLYAASDPLETLAMAQELVVLDAGRVVQAGPVERIYAEPASEDAMRLVGFPRANLLPGHAAGGRVEAGPLAFAARAPDGPVTVGFRPEAPAPAAPGAVALEGTVTLVEDLGAELVIYLDCAGTPVTLARAAEEGPPPETGAPLRLGVAPPDLVVFTPAAGEGAPRDASSDRSRAAGPTPSGGAA